MSTAACRTSCTWACCHGTAVQTSRSFGGFSATLGPSSALFFSAPLILVFVKGEYVKSKVLKYTGIVVYL